MLIVHRGETAGALVGGLAEVLAEAPDDPLVGEVVVVPTRGIERWLTQQLSLLPAGGRPAPLITANIDFRFPRRFYSDLLAAVEGVDTHRWDRTSLMWEVLDALDEHLADPAFAPVRAFVSDAGADSANRIVAADRIARLFARYDHQFPAMLRAWAADEDTGPDGLELDPGHRWQPRLWRAVRRSIGLPSLAELLDEIGETLATDRDLLDLPDRLSLYGFTAVPEGELKVLTAVARSRDVHLFVLHASDTAWTAPADAEPRNGLLRSWGRDAHQLRRLLADLPVDRHVHHPAPPAGDDTLLARLQTRLRTDAVNPATVPLDPGDRSVQIHACHGPRRQVDVARDAILHALAADPTLEPRDIVIMCPDVEAFAPLIEAAFHPDATDGLGIPPIRLRIADRAPVAVNPLADLVARLVAVARSRATATEIIEFLDLASVRRRFWLDDPLVAELVKMILELDVRWGFDADHRATHGLTGRPELTWAAGLDRLAAGAFFADRPLGTVNGVLPLAGMESGDLFVASVLCEIVNRFERVGAAMQSPAPPWEWRERLIEAADLLGASDWESQWERPALLADLERLLPDAPYGDGHVLTVAEVEVVLEDLRRTRPTTANHRSGDLTVCTLVPMRSVPHRVICLVGMDDGRFPRNPLVDGDDLLGGRGLPGVRDPASEDRQLLLDAVLAAGERLIVTYSGRDERTNAPLPPSVPVAELADEIDDAAPAGADGSRSSHAVTVHHPLQPFDPVNFTPDALTTGVWGFDRHLADGARALLAAAPDPPPVEWLEWEPPDVIDLADLRAFLQHPVQAFVSTRLGFRRRERDPLREDHLPLELDNLAQWGIGDTLLRHALAGVERAATVETLAAGARLPVGTLADSLVERLAGEVDAIVEAARQAGIGEAAGDTVAVDVTLPDGRRLTGTVGDVTAEGVERVVFSRPGPKRTLALWVDLLAASAMADQPLRAVAIARDRRRPDVTRLASPAGDHRAWALDGLARLVDLYLRGMAAPLPLFEQTSFAFATGAEPEKVQTAWEGSEWSSGEAADAHHCLAFGGERAFADIVAIPPGPDERGGSWPAGDSRFAVLARRLWEPVLAAREEEA